MYNVTIAIDPRVEQEWVQWMIKSHIPDVIATGSFLSHSMQKVLSGDEDAGITYAIQYVAPDMATFEQYQVQHAARLQQLHKEKYEGQYAAFRTLMEIVDATVL